MKTAGTPERMELIPETEMEREFCSHLIGHKDATIYWGDRNDGSGQALIINSVKPRSFDLQLGGPPCGAPDYEEQNRVQVAMQVLNMVQCPPSLRNDAEEVVRKYLNPLQHHTVAHTANSAAAAWAAKVWDLGVPISGEQIKKSLDECKLGKVRDARKDQDLLIFYYPHGDMQAKAAAEANAKTVHGKMTMLVARGPNEVGPSVEQVPAGVANARFDKEMEKLVVGKSVSDKLTLVVTLERGKLQLTFSNGVRSIIERSDWTVNNSENNAIQMDINRLLVQSGEAVGEDNIDDERMFIRLTTDQAQMIANTREYKNYCMGAPDALSPDYEQQAQRRYDAERGIWQAALKTGDRLYGLRVIVEDSIGSTALPGTKDYKLVEQDGFNIVLPKPITGKIVLCDGFALEQDGELQLLLSDGKSYIQPVHDWKDSPKPNPGSPGRMESDILQLISKTDASVDPVNLELSLTARQARMIAVTYEYRQYCYDKNMESLTSHHNPNRKYGLMPLWHKGIKVTVIEE